MSYGGYDQILWHITFYGNDMGFMVTKMPAWDLHRSADIHIICVCVGLSVCITKGNYHLFYCPICMLATMGLLTTQTKGESN